MFRGDKRWLVAGLLVVAGAGLFFALRPSGKRDGLTRAEADGPGFDGFRARDVAPSPLDPPEIIAERIEAAMTSWRHAIVVRDADTVLALDREFAGAPARYAPALVKCAETDGDERVRAFCTRVLGKLKAADRVELYERLLVDKSPYVRQNAAWALGELAETTNGHMVTRHALAELRHVRAKDPAGAVREAAQGALEKLE
jgi:HEAT repeat protein